MAEQSKHRSIIIKSLTAVVMMLAFVFYGLVPMYDLICEWTGVTGRTGGVYEETETVAVQDRVITVQFLALNNEGMTWDFYPNVRTVKVRPGEFTTVSFHAGNSSDQTMMAQAIPSVSPFQGANYFHKTECFCFKQQTLAAGETEDMALRFMIDPELPETIDTLTLSYTLFDITQVAANGEKNGQ